ncbi:MAG: hypothetical protein RBQ91_01825 [Acholeplasma sp.]|nr:hypothetical protein [Acholeplasma sp.]
MKKTIVIILLLAVHFYSNGLKVSASGTITESKSRYWNIDYADPDFSHVGHTYVTGTWRDGLVKNKTWTYVDIQFSNKLGSEFVGLLTTPFLSPHYVYEIELSYVYQQEFIQTMKSELYLYVDLPDGYTASSNLYTTYNVNKSYKGYSVSKILNQDTYSEYTSGYEYSLALYKLVLNVKYTETYRYEIGSLWSKSIRQTVKHEKEDAVVAYVVVPVRTDVDYTNPDYLFNVHNIGKDTF